LRSAAICAPSEALHSKKAAVCLRKRLLLSSRNSELLVFGTSSTVAAISAAPTVSSAVAAISTTATESATIATAIAPIAPFAGRAVFARLCLIDADRATLEVLVVQRCNGCSRFFTIRHFDEAEASRLAREFVQDHARRADCTMCFKSGPKIRVRSTVRKIANEYVHYLLYL